VKVYLILLPEFPRFNVDGVFATRELAEQAIAAMRAGAGYLIREWWVATDLDEWIEWTRRGAPEDPLGEPGG
jgi:hypothetical protein